MSDSNSILNESEWIIAPQEDKLLFDTGDGSKSGRKLLFVENARKDKLYREVRRHMSENFSKAKVFTPRNLD